MGTNLKFFGPNELNSSDSYTFTSASANLDYYLYDDDLSKQLTSSGSDDVTDEVITVDFSNTVTADRIFVGNHNIKAGNLQYSDDDQGSWKDFSPAISWSANTDTHNYYEVTEVSGITDLRLTINTTQTVNDEKRVGQLRLFSELHEMVKNPWNVDREYFKKQIRNETDSGGSRIVNKGTKFRATIFFSGLQQTDSDALWDVSDRNSSFYVYMGGGRTDLWQRGWRVQDMYLVNWLGAFAPAVKGRIYDLGDDIQVDLEEV